MIAKLLVFQHVAVEHPGILRDFMRADGIMWDAVELDEGENIPELKNYDGLIVMGGPMDVWEEDQHPWLVEEKRAIRSAIEDHDLPFLGLCLGHQLLAEAMGGKVGKAATPEIGVLDVNLTSSAKDDAVFASFEQVAPALQWHSAEVLRAPDTAVVLAESSACKVQAMRIGRKAYGLQYHVEVEADTVQNWSEIPAYANALESNLGKDALPGFKQAVDNNMASFNNQARKLYDGFKTLL